MRTNRTRITLGLLGLALLALAACTSVPTVSAADDIPAAIANTKTPADHQAIADFFKQKAASYEADAALHERMSNSYERPSVYGRNSIEASTAHCRMIQHQLRAAAVEAKGLEQAHRELAASLK